MQTRTSSGILDTSMADRSNINATVETQMFSPEFQPTPSPVQYRPPTLPSECYHQLLNAPSNKPTYSSVLQSAIQGSDYSFTLSRHINAYLFYYSEPSHMPPATKKTGQSYKPSVNTTAIYVSGMLYARYTKVKGILAAEPIGVQLRHIQNLSCIDK